MLKNKEGANAPKKSISDIISQISKSAIKTTKKELNLFENEWVIPNFLYKNSLVMIYSSAGSGKSWFAYSLSNYILKNNSNFEEIIYLDADNGKVTLKNRNISKILDNVKFTHWLINGVKDYDIFNKLKSYNLSNRLFIIDSIRNFMSNVNFNSDKEVLAFLSDLQEMRNNGATIIFLHHQPKQVDGENNKLYKGSTSFIDSVDEAYWLNNISDKTQNFILCLEPQKRRDETKINCFELNANELNLTIKDEKNIKILNLNQKEKITIDLVCEIINLQKEINQSNLSKKLNQLANERAYDIIGKNSLWRLLDDFNNILFKITKDSHKNQKIFYKI
ncbi:AAA family ATPase [Campylobacter ureolyticus]|uniref:AAA family ATPase n=1 Tax=Campylobacter ureolyticus TaxID=827 RepID=UPI0022B542A8|nr:AAA family ATPase [Campylobacter ureolyticus]MCZ6156736.1 AAA family ATPase [Campylobacter ureolyticus]